MLLEGKNVTNETVTMCLTLRTGVALSCESEQFPTKCNIHLSK